MPHTQDQRRALPARFQAGNYGLNDQGYAPVAVTYSGEDARNPANLLGFQGNFSGFKNGDTYDLYGTNGDFAGRRAIDNKSFEMMDLAPLALFTAGQLGWLGAGGAGGEAAGVTGLPSGADASMFWDMGAAPSTATMGAGASTVPMAEMAGTSAAGGAGSTISGIANSLGISPSLLGVGASLLGAAAGSKGVKSETTREPWGPVADQLTGDQGLLNMAGNMARNQMQNNRWGDIGNQAMGLLSAPVAGNGFNQFMQRPRFGVRG